MLIRLLMMNVVPERLDDWMRYTSETGFPAMRAQPGCRSVTRLRYRAGDPSHAIMTVWDDIEAFERFKSGPAPAELARLAQGLTVRPYTELLFDVVED
jgi:heme-degrading monooxygenase HmoA